LQTIAIVGAGPGVGLAVAREFARHDFAAGLVARNPERLADLVRVLGDEGITAISAPADITRPSELVTALDTIKQEIGPVDVLEFSPLTKMDVAAHAVDTTVEKAQAMLDVYVVGAVTSVQSVLPDMLERGDGGLLFTSASSSHTPIPLIANTAMAMAALRSYVLCLHEELAPRGIYAGHLPIGLKVEPGSEASPETVAAILWEMYAGRQRAERRVPEGPGADKLAEQGVKERLREQRG
jgi:short-subunit dehydrogenase